MQAALFRSGLGQSVSLTRCLQLEFHYFEAASLFGRSSRIYTATGRRVKGKSINGNNVTTVFPIKSKAGQIEGPVNTHQSVKLHRVVFRKGNYLKYRQKQFRIFFNVVGVFRL